MIQSPSLRSRLLVGLLRLLRTKTILPLVERAWKGIDVVPRGRYCRSCFIKSSETAGSRVWTLTPKKGKTDRRIFYLHGGSYVLGFLQTHWRFLARLAAETGCTIVAPDYPLAPEFHTEDVFAMVLPLYRRQAEEFGAGRIFLMGDSAGGGLSLALAQKLKEENLPQPAHIILLAPWLDVTMTNPEITEVDKLDPYLRVDGLKEAGKAYAGSVSTKDPMVSPLNGDLRNLAPVTLYVGTYDILVADCRRLLAKAREQDARISYHEIPGMIHSGILLSLPEARKVRREMAGIILTS